MVLAHVDEFAAENPDRLRVAKHNVDQQPQTAPKHDVTALPTLLVFKNGAVVGMKIGAISKGQLVEFLTPLL